MGSAEGDSRAAAESFARQLAEAGVPEGLRQVLWELSLSWWQRRGRRPSVAAIVDEYGHWRLFQASRSGDRDAARQFESYWTRALQHLMRRGFSRDQVEEIAGEFFARIYASADEFGWKSPFTAYLRTVILNLMRDEVRRIERARRAGLELAPTAEPIADRTPAAGCDPEQELLRGERAAAVRDALASLAPLDQHLVRQSLLEGRSGEELAAAAGLSRQAVYQRVHRAKKHLLAVLSADPRLGS